MYVCGVLHNVPIGDSCKAPRCRCSLRGAAVSSKRMLIRNPVRFQLQPYRVVARTYNAGVKRNAHVTPVLRF